MGNRTIKTLLAASLLAASLLGKAEAKVVTDTFSITGTGAINYTDNTWDSTHHPAGERSPIEPMSVRLSLSFDTDNLKALNSDEGNVVASILDQNFPVYNGPYKLMVKAVPTTIYSGHFGGGTSLFISNAAGDGKVGSFTVIMDVSGIGADGNPTNAALREFEYIGGNAATGVMSGAFLTTKGTVQIAGPYQPPASSYLGLGLAVTVLGGLAALVFKRLEQDEVGSEDQGNINQGREKP